MPIDTLYREPVTTGWVTKIMTMTIPTFVYLDVGSRQSPHLSQDEFGIEIEIQYSLSTLKADNSAEHRVVIYTDKPERYQSCLADVVDVSETHTSNSLDLAYAYRVKPLVLLHALRKFGGVCVFLDSDTYIRQGFTLAVRHMINHGAIFFEVRSEPAFSKFPLDIPPCPHHADHKPSLLERQEGNSGVIGMKAGWGEAILEDALHLIDIMRARGDRVRTLEQTAIFEAVWLSGRKALEIKPWIEHYCRNSRKRYMHSQIKRLLKQYGRPLPASEPNIKCTKARVKIYQYYWDVRRLFMNTKRVLLKG